MHEILVKWQNGKSEKLEFKEYRFALQSFSELVQVPKQPVDVAFFDKMEYYGKSRTIKPKETEKK